MKSPMLPADHQAAMRRVLALGRSGDAAVLPELIGMLRTPSNEVQRLAVSAIGKLAEFGADAGAAVAALAPLAMKARHPQTQQYAIRALKKYAASAGAHVLDLRDLARNPAQRDYVRAERRWATNGCCGLIRSRQRRSACGSPGPASVPR